LRRLRDPWLVLVAAGAAVGIVLRIWVLASPIGGLDGDEAVWGLMARHVLDGELPIFFWGQSYGGTQETLLTAAVFALAGSGTLTVRLVAMALFALAALLVWRVGRRTVGEPAARLGAVLFWIGPSYLVWKSTRAHGFYGAVLVLALAVLLLALRLRDGAGERDLAGLGLAVGLGWWATPQIAFVAAPLLAWLAWRRRDLLRRGWIVFAAAAAGASPWLVWTLRHGSQSVESPFGDTGTYLDHLRTFFYATLPQALGVRAPFTLDWLPNELVGRLVEALVLVAVAWAAFRRGRREALVVVAVAYPFLQSLSPFASLNEEPRYVVLLVPILALLVADALARRAWMAVAGTALATGASVAGLASMGNVEPPVPPVGGLRVPAELGPALETLDRLGQRRVRANYAIAYRITFESGERIIATSTGQVRYRPYDRLVRAEPNPAEVFVAGSREERKAADGLGQRGYRRVSTGDWSVYVRR
jgi:4-amino-4-deoxy-L-arabinose transferase-like glycosyltransferase